MKPNGIDSRRPSDKELEKNKRGMARNSNIEFNYMVVVIPQT